LGFHVEESLVFDTGPFGSFFRSLGFLSFLGLFRFLGLFGGFGRCILGILRGLGILGILGILFSPKFLGLLNNLSATTSRVGSGDKCWWFIVLPVGWFHYPLGSGVSQCPSTISTKEKVFVRNLERKSISIPVFRHLESLV